MKQEQALELGAESREKASADSVAADQRHAWPLEHVEASDRLGDVDARSDRNGNREVKWHAVPRGRASLSPIVGAKTT